jgi:hypothetical protein
VDVDWGRPAGPPARGAGASRRNAQRDLSGVRAHFALCPLSPRNQHKKRFGARGGVECREGSAPAAAAPADPPKPGRSWPARQRVSRQGSQEPGAPGGGCGLGAPSRPNGARNWRNQAQRATRSVVRAHFFLRSFMRCCPSPREPARQLRGGATSWLRRGVGYWLLPQGAGLQVTRRA